MSFHPLDLKNEDISRIEMLFPKNPIKIGSIYHGLELNVNSLFFLILQEFEAELATILMMPRKEVHELVNNIDHEEDDRITWGEVVNWLIKEGRIKNIANDQRLFNFTLARLTESEHFKLGQYNIPKILPIQVEHPSGKIQQLYLVLFDETCNLELFEERNFQKSIYKFEFSSTYHKPKPLDAFPGLREKKIAQLQLQLGLSKPDPRPFTGESTGGRGGLNSFNSKRRLNRAVTAGSDYQSD